MIKKNKINDHLFTYVFHTFIILSSNVTNFNNKIILSIINIIFRQYCDKIVIIRRTNITVNKINLI